VSAPENTPTLNIDLAEKVLAQITEHPELHDQQYYGMRRDCGTTHCVAGWAIALSPGVEFTWRPWDDGFEIDGVSLPDYGVTDPEVAGRELLGLDLEAAEHLFLDLDESEAIVFLRQLIADAKAVAAYTRQVSA
jgi:hypothetical protein